MMPRDNFEPPSNWVAQRAGTYRVSLRACSPITRGQTNYVLEAKVEQVNDVSEAWITLGPPEVASTERLRYDGLTGIGCIYNMVLWRMHHAGYSMVEICEIVRPE